MLRPFPNYRQTELNWLKRLPDSWGILRTKQVFRLRIQKAPKNNQMELLSIYTHIGVKPRKELEQRGNKASTTDGYWIVKKGDIISNKLLAWMGAVGVSHYVGVTSPAYDILRPIQRCNTDYYHYLFRTPTYLQQFKIRSRGIMDMRLRLYFDQLGQIPVPVPPHGEQDAIVLFLNWKTAQINKFIRNKRRFIELLKEQKQNVINQAVTRGLDPNVKLKPSGVEWIGDIPEHWEVAPLKHLASINARVLPESTDQNYTFKYFDISSVGTGCLSGEPETLRFGQAPSRARRILKRGDTILSTVRTYLKAVYYVSDEVEDWIASTGFAALTPKKAIHPPFLGLVIQSDNFINRVIRESIGVAYPAIAETKLGTLHLAYPESIEEQQAILEHIADSSKAIDQAIIRAQREIELMREYRTRLISDVVTGQVDVRGVEVPEVAEEELLALDEDTGESDDMIDDEGGMDETD
ncbi:MAG: restriction endonuclease subunit S [Sedimenticola sp.]|nr:MAG: restriction endonuclease subunit S [Sedimenticola sp.]